MTQKYESMKMERKWKVWESFLKGEKHMRYLTVLFLTAALAGIASADVSYDQDGIQLDVTHLALPVGSDPGVTDMSNLRSNMLDLTTSADWLSAILVVELTETGQVFQYPFPPYDDDGRVDSPSQDLIDNGVPPYVPPLPGLAYDTYLSNGTLGAAVQTANPGDWGYADEQFDADAIAEVWWTIATDDIGTMNLASVTLDRLAQGQWRFRATMSPAGPEGPALDTGWQSVEDGFLVPEPATLGLLAIGGLGMLIRRKR